MRERGFVMWSRIVVLAVAAWMAGAAQVEALDLHAFWDQSCGECHGRVDAFATKRLKAEGETIVGKSRGRDLRPFLARHHLSDAALAERLYAMLRGQVATAPLYTQRCAGCHASAPALARGSLGEVDGAVVAKGSREPLALFLGKHGGASAQEIPTLVGALERIRSEVKGP